MIAVSDDDEGVLSTPADEARQFFARTFDPAAGELRFEQAESLWGAAELARTLGAAGEGRTVAIIDAGFDLSIEKLANACHPASVTDPATLAGHGPHGTIVALLVLAVAPRARLLLLDATARGRISRSAVADAIGVAAAEGADVINLSLQFASSARFLAHPAIDIALLGATDPDPAAFAAMAEANRALAVHYEPGGCGPACAICRQLDQVDPGIVVLAAAGNTDGILCPTSHDTALGVGFIDRETAELPGDTDAVLNRLPENFVQDLRLDLSVTQPEGFAGTSFASPLVAGLAAVVDEPSSDLWELAVSANRSVPVTNLHWITDLRAKQGTAPTAQTIQVLRDGYQAVFDRLPDRHRHGATAPVEPCIACSGFVRDWYLNATALSVNIDRPDEARRFCEQATTIIPNDPGIANNLRRALSRT